MVESLWLKKRKTKKKEKKIKQNANKCKLKLLSCLFVCMSIIYLSFFFLALSIYNSILFFHTSASDDAAESCSAGISTLSFFLSERFKRQMLWICRAVPSLDCGYKTLEEEEEEEEKQIVNKKKKK